MQEDHGGERHGVAERVDQPGRYVGGVEDGLQQPGHGGFGDRAEGERAQCDAELGGGHHPRQVLQAVEHLAGALGAGGEGLDLAAAYGDERELGADEETVGQDQEQGEEELERVHRPAASSSAGTAGLGAVRTRRTRSAR